MELNSLGVLSALTSLTSLEMNNFHNRNKVSMERDNEMRGFSCLTKLQVLRIQNFRNPHGLPEGFQQGIAGMTGLRVLDMARCDMHPISSQRIPTAAFSNSNGLPGLWFLHNLTGLVDLDLSGLRDAEPAMLSSLSSLSQLTRLSLQRQVDFHAKILPCDTCSI